MSARATRRNLLAAALLALPVALSACPQPQPGGGQNPGGANPGAGQPAAVAEPVVAGRVAILKNGTVKAYTDPIEPFKTSLGQPVNLFDLAGQPRSEAAKKTVAALVASKPPLIFAIGGDALDLARESTKGIPIVFASVINFQKHGVAGVENVCGIALEVAPETMFTQLKIVAPAVKRIGVIHSAATTEVVAEAKAQAGGLQIEIVEASAETPDAVAAAWDTLKGKIDALWMPPDPGALSQASFDFLRGATLSEPGIPFLGPSLPFVKAGALLSVAADYGAAGSQAGIAASQIVGGDSTPKDIGVKPPVGTVSSLNMNTLDSIKLKVDDTVLKNVDELWRDKEPFEKPDEKKDDEKPKEPK